MVHGGTCGASCDPPGWVMTVPPSQDETELQRAAQAHSLTHSFIHCLHSYLFIYLLRAYRENTSFWLLWTISQSIMLIRTM